jgi:putative endonuclease
VLRSLSTTEKGKRGEDQAEAYLLEQGFSILSRNFRFPGGEIDFIATKGSKLIVFEVKCWSGKDSWTLAESITPLKIRRLKQSIPYIFSRFPGNGDVEIQFDVVFFGSDGVEHFEDVFWE